MKLYRSIRRPDWWFAYSRVTGWVMFPAKFDGWNKRQPARGIDPIDVREVPLELAAETGIPGALAEYTEAA